MLKPLAAIVVLFVVAALMACGGSSSPATPTPPVTETATSSPAASPTATSEPAATSTPSPTSAPSPTVAPSPTPGAEAQIVEHGPRDSNRVALTFDMGGRVDPALDIMQFLIDNDVRATIFMTGAIVESPNTETGREVLGIICDRADLFEPANHSYSHPDFRQLGDDQIAEELSTTEEAMTAECPRSPRPLFRPPLGGMDLRVADAVAANGYPYSVMWDIDTIDWRPESDGGPTAADISSKVLANAQGGSIVLMHLGGYNTLDALPAIVNGLRDQGYELVSVSELLGLQQ